MIAVIGGSGFEKFDEFEILEDLTIETPFGVHSTSLKKVRIKDLQDFLFISRHGKSHELLPSEINYRANIFALKKLGATALVSFSAVGSLQKEFAPGDLVVPYQYIDRTKSRISTFLGGGLVGHVSLAHPICEVMAENLKNLIKDINFELNNETNKTFKTHFGQTYVCIEGPYFSTLAESNSYRQLKADIIGMSHFPEYALAREAGLPYLPCCFVTDYDCWDTSRPHVTIQEVIEVMKANNLKAFKVLKSILNKPDIAKGSTCPEGGLKSGLFMTEEMIPENKIEWLNILRK